MSTTFWAVFAGATSAFLVVKLLDNILNEISNRRHARFLEAMDDEFSEFYCDCD
jgi:hypothetical protein